jgi:hypothetical protein
MDLPSFFFFLESGRFPGFNEMSHTTTSLSQKTLDHFKSLRFRKAKTNACLYLKIDQDKLVGELQTLRDT